MEFPRIFPPVVSFKKAGVAKIGSFKRRKSRRERLRRAKKDSPGSSWKKWKEAKGMKRKRKAKEKVMKCERRLFHLRPTKRERDRFERTFALRPVWALKAHRSDLESLPSRLMSGKLFKWRSWFASLQNTRKFFSRISNSMTGFELYLLSFKLFFQSSKTTLFGRF